MPTTAPRPAPHHRLWTAVVRRARDHHESVNAAYAAYYGPGTATGREPSRPSCSSSPPAPVVVRKASWSSSSSYPSSPSSSSLFSAAAPSAPGPRQYAGRAWRAVKRRAREHHESVEASYAALYGR